MKLWKGTTYNRIFSNQIDAIAELNSTVIGGWRRRKHRPNSDGSVDMDFISPDKTEMFSIIENINKKTNERTYLLIRLERWILSPNAGYRERYHHSYESQYGHLINVNSPTQARMLMHGFRRFTAIGCGPYIRPYLTP